VAGPIDVSQYVLLFATTLGVLSGGRSAVQMAVRLQPCPLSRRRRKGRRAIRGSVDPMRTAAHVRSRAGIVVMYAVVGGIDGIRVRVCRLVSRGWEAGIANGELEMKAAAVRGHQHTVGKCLGLVLL
jgi:hypothetical protein